MIDHSGVSVSDYARSKAFYQAALAPIGYVLLAEIPPSVTGGIEVAGFGEQATSKPDFWISGGEPNRPPVHLAFRVSTRALVDQFYKAGLEAGGTDNGGPGPR